ncbi:hypothetical protein PACTADRAFT_66279 [Pachysolen tannophilus NRRL Y-2460]|uniref:PAN2-PAN3 deadenylation complex catalytic subunit PAN2 n=1 Tax=Pachysolen tannophilus NRRL Y-2460 TaxID=669874 RepID=A0A1E4TZZ9_PACTA|nr:hypothetical protein PACTADRAFT_66279 [Pachysolen tannophilus NRRL Y-2460]
MEGWSEILRVPGVKLPKVVPTLLQDKPPIQASLTSILFDDAHDLIWLSDTDGYVSSLNYIDNPNFTDDGFNIPGQILVPYTSFKACNNSPVFQIKTHSSGILSLSNDSIKLTTREGLAIFQLLSKDNDFINLQSMTYTSSFQNEILIGGLNNGKLYKVDLSKGVISSTIPYEHDITKLTTNNRHIIIGKADGSIDLMDPTSNEIIKSFPSNTQAISDMDCREHTLLTCGYSKRDNQFINDRLVNVFDLRIMKSLQPIPFPAGAAYVRLHPKLPSLAVIGSQSGQIHFVNIFNPANVHFYQGDIGTYMSYMDISPSGDFLCFGDSLQNIHLWSHNPKSSFSNYSNKLEYPSPVFFPPQNANTDSIDNSNISLSATGMPYYKETLLSALPYELKWKVGQVPKKLDPEILTNSNFLEDGFLRYAPYDANKYGKRNLANEYFSVRYQKKIGLPKFISEKLNDDDNDQFNRELNTEAIFDFHSHSSNVIPNCFSKLEILYSKFGVDDFDFDYYNKTKYSGLETHVSNSYSNSLLQLYRFASDIFNFVIGNLTEEHLEEDSLLTELGYLFDMLVKANGKHFRPSNFQHVLNSIPEAHQYGLVNDTANSNDEFSARRLIQSFNTFLMDRIAYDDVRQHPNQNGRSSQLNNICGIFIEDEIKSLNCSYQARQSSLVYTLNVGPPQFMKLNNRRLNLNILSFIEASMSNTIQRNVWCEKCYRQHFMEHSMTVKNLPNLLSINLNLDNEVMNDIKNFKKWLVPEFYAYLNGRGKIELKSFMIKDNCRKYDLLGYVAEITTKDNENNFVSFIKITENDEKDGDTKQGWYLFNDFLVMPIPEEEVFNLNYWWKKPVILLYRSQESASHAFDFSSWKSHMDDSILYRDHFANGIRQERIIEYELLTKEEAPKPGTLIGIDAEFVVLEPEKVEIRSDGAKSLIRPKRQSLARVSVVRGEGPKEGVPFIDDYIVTTLHIDDYLTSFSGIEPGDLDPSVSKKSLVSLSVAYRRLWLLLNLQCVFIGHGLSSDFRTINIEVPKEQVRDTAVYFYLKQHKRKLSLKFLSYILLKERVQTGNHDSIEDARTALTLYKKYLELKEKGELTSTLNWIYSEGHNMRFKPPQ